MAGNDREAALALTVSEEKKLNSKGFSVIKQLGEGSYAKVYLTEYKCQQHRTKERLACKIIDVSKAPKDYLGKFLPRELNILVKLNHPYIIHVHSIYLRKSKYYIFMRYAEYGDLLQYLLTHGGICEKHARLWFRQICLGLQYLHNLEIAHRDLKCENLLISSNFNMKIADFGFARYVVDKNNVAILSETYCGSFAYAAPEIIYGKPYFPKKCDMWSLGVILFVMINESMPFDDTNLRKMLESQFARKWKIRNRLVDVLSDDIKRLIPMLLEPDIAVRYDIDQVLASSWIQSMDPKITKVEQILPSTSARPEKSVKIINQKPRKTATPTPTTRPAITNIHRQGTESDEKELKVVTTEVSLKRLSRLDD